MMHHLAAQYVVDVAEPSESVGGEIAIAHLRFLKAEDIWRLLDQEFLDDGEARSDRIDVPGRDLQHFGHGGSVSGGPALCRLVGFCTRLRNGLAASSQPEN
jgi:hypothetical protein